MQRDFASEFCNLRGTRKNNNNDAGTVRKTELEPILYQKREKKVKEKDPGDSTLAIDLAMIQLARLNTIINKGSHVSG